MVKIMSERLKYFWETCNCNLFTHEALRSSYELVEKCPCVPDRIGIWKCWCLGRGENRSTSEQERTNNKLNPHGIDTGIWSRATLAGGDCSHHCTTLAPLTNSLKNVRAFQIELEFGSVGVWGEGKTGVPRSKREPTTNSTHMASTLGFDLGPHWREAIALTTAPPLLPDKYFFSLTSIITNAGATNA